jgi:hypothetical protein
MSLEQAILQEVGEAELYETAILGCLMVAPPQEWERIARDPKLGTEIKVRVPDKVAAAFAALFSEMSDEGLNTLFRELASIAFSHVLVIGVKSILSRRARVVADNFQRVRTIRDMFDLTNKGE